MKLKMKGDEKLYFYMVLVNKQYYTKGISKKLCHLIYENVCFYRKRLNYTTLFLNIFQRIQTEGNLLLGRIISIY